VSLNFTPAVRSEAKARVAILGPTGAGKTWTALEWATVLADGGSIAAIDTENASASLYADQFQFVTAAWWPPYDATKLAAAIKDAAANHAVIVLDSLTHFWAGEGGVLDVVDRFAERDNGRRPDTFAAWKKGSPIWRGLLDALIFAPCHVVVTMRSKMEHAIVESNGRKTVEKLGMAPQARNDVEYEFTVVGELDQQHRLTITKSRCSALADLVAAPHQAGQLATTLRDWLGTAVAQPVSGPPVTPADPPTDNQRKRAQILAKELWGDNRTTRLGYWSGWAGRDITSFNDLTEVEAADVIDRMADLKRKAGTGAPHSSEAPASPSSGAAVANEPALGGATRP
jgi:hypothetical protein